jgi:hypothetical protein
MSNIGADDGARPADSSSARRDLQRLELLAEWMDRRYLDPILGLLLPGAGDAMGAAMGLLGVVSAVRLRAHPIVIARMLLNLALDSVLGAIPLLGAVLDFFYKAHSRNLVLLKTRDVRKPRASDWLMVGAAGLAFVLALCLPLLVLLGAVTWLWSGLRAP